MRSAVMRSERYHKRASRASTSLRQSDTPGPCLPEEVICKALLFTALFDIPSTPSAISIDVHILILLSPMIDSTVRQEDFEGKAHCYNLISIPRTLKPTMSANSSPPYATVTETDHRAWIWIAASLGIVYSTIFLVIRSAARRSTGRGFAFDDILLVIGTVGHYNVQPDIGFPARTLRGSSKLLTRLSLRFVGLSSHS